MSKRQAVCLVTARSSELAHTRPSGDGRRLLATHDGLPRRVESRRLRKRTGWRASTLLPRAVGRTLGAPRRVGSWVVDMRFLHWFMLGLLGALPIALLVGPDRLTAQPDDPLE